MNETATRRAPVPRPKFVRLALSVAVRDPAALLRHARGLWEESGRPRATAPSTIEEAARVALVELADGTPPPEFGVEIHAEDRTPPTVFHRMNRQVLPAILEGELRRAAADQEERTIAVRVGLDVHMTKVVEVTARSLEEAEEKARRMMRKKEIDLEPAGPVDYTEFAWAEG